MQKSSDEGKWCDFSVSQTGLHDPQSLFKNFIEFKRIFDSQSKKELISRGWIKNENDMGSLADVFRDLNYGGFSTLYRKNASADESKTFLWLSKVKSKAQQQLMLNGGQSFVKLDKTELKKIIRMSVDESSLLALPEVLFKYGVILVYERGVSGMKVDGATFLLPNGVPVVAVSFRYPRLDNFWFTLMHELAHVVLHREQLIQPIVDDLDSAINTPIEIAANRLAKSTIVDRHKWRNCKAKYSKDVGSIESFANEIGVHKSIIAGLLRNEAGDYKTYSSIVNAINPRDIVFND